MKKDSIFLKIVKNLDIFVAVVALIVLVGLTSSGVIMRYIVGKPYTWLEEVQLFCMVWIVFGAGGAAFRTGNHVAIEMVVEMLPKSVQKIVEIIIDLVVFSVISYLFIQSIRFVGVFVSSERSTSMLKIPYTLIYGIAPASYLLMIISYFTSKYINKNEEEINEEGVTI